MSFNPEIFAALLERAKGKRSINKYGSDSDVDPGYISRLLRCQTDGPPSASVISKLANKAHNDITVEELLIAAGYLPEEFKYQIADRVLRLDIAEMELIESFRKAVAKDSDLTLFWNDLLKRDDLQLLFKQVKELSPDTIRRIIKYIKMVEDEESQES